MIYDMGANSKYTPGGIMYPGTGLDWTETSSTTSVLPPQASEEAFRHAHGWEHHIRTTRRSRFMWNFVRTFLKWRTADGITT